MTNSLYNNHSIIYIVVIYAPTWDASCILVFYTMCSRTILDHHGVVFIIIGLMKPTHIYYLGYCCVALGFLGFYAGVLLFLLMRFLLAFIVAGFVLVGGGLRLLCCSGLYLLFFPLCVVSSPGLSHLETCFVAL
jgi:hypothetical protein